MSKIQIAVETTDVNEVNEAIALLQLIASGKAPAVTKKTVVQEPDVEELDMSDLGDEEEEEEEEDDGLGDLLGDEEEEEPAAPTIDDLKDVFKLVISKKGKDAGTAFVKKVLTKMKVSGMKDIKEDKRQAFVDVLTKFAKK